MLRMCVYMHFRFVENHPIWILEDGPLISEGVLSHLEEFMASKESLLKLSAIISRNWSTTIEEDDSYI
jgi:hypothetical protein